MTPEEQRARELALYRRYAIKGAELVRRVMESHPELRHYLWMLSGGNSADFSKGWKAIGLALAGKVRFKKSDALILAAIKKAIAKRLEERRKRGRRGLDVSDLVPTVEEIDNAIAILAGKTPVTKSKKAKDRKRSLRRKVQILTEAKLPRRTK